MSKKEQIFKVQLPLYTNAPEPQAHVYNEDRSFIGEVPITEDLKSLFPPGVFKIFVTGTIDDKGVVDVGGAVYQEDELDW